MQHLPTVLLAFANAKDDLQLKEESSALKDAFLLLEHEGLVNLEREESVEVDELTRRLVHYQQDLVMFHYAGHASGVDLQLEGGDANAKGLAGMLAQSPYLQLVFLNGCETLAQADALLALGVPTVIATSIKINDAMAKDFAKVFYEKMVRQETIQRAFQAASSAMEMKYTGSSHAALRSLSWDEPSDEAGLPWRLLGSESGKQWKIGLDLKTWLNLRQGANTFLRELLQGPFRHHRKLVEPMAKEGKDPQYAPILATMPSPLAADRAMVEQMEVRHVEVQIADGEALPFPVAVERLGQSGQPHCWLLGKPGSGRTGAVVMLWYECLARAQRGEWAPVPIFIDLFEVQDELQRGQSDNLLLDFIAKYYLELEGLSEIEERNQISRLMSQTPEPGRGPGLLLLLDGDVHQPQLYQQIAELAQKDNVQIVYTAKIKSGHVQDRPHSHHLREFQYLTIKALDKDEVRSRLSQQVIGGFRKEVEDLLGNMAWFNTFLTFYDKINSGFPWEYILDFSTEAEMMWNSLEGQLQEKVKDPLDHPERLYVNRFYLRHFLPKLAYLMDSKQLNEWTEDELLETIDEVSPEFYKREFLKVFPDYRRYMKLLRMDADSWVDKEERFGILTELGKEFGIFTVTRKSKLVDSFARDYRYLKQEFTYTIGNPVMLHFLSAVHVRNDIQMSLSLGEFPETLRKGELAKPVRKMLGQLEGVSRQKTQSGLMRLLERCRGVFHPKQVGHTVWNILTIWRELNEYFIGLSLIRLDLRGIKLDKLSKELIYEPYYLASNLAGSLLDFQDILVSKDSFPLAGSYSSTGKTYLSAESDGLLRQWDTQLGICYRSLPADGAAHAGAIYTAQYTMDDAYIVTGSADGYIRVWDQTKEKLLTQIPPTSQRAAAVYALACQPVPHESDAIYLLRGREWVDDQDPPLDLWKVHLGLEEQEPEHLLSLPGHLSDVHGVDLRVEGDYALSILSGSWDNQVRYWEVDLRDKSFVCHVQTRHVSRVHDVSFSPFGQYAVSASSDDTVIVWNLAQPDQRQIRRLKRHIRSVNAIRLWQESEAGRLWLISGGADGKALIWDLHELWSAEMPRGEIEPSVELLLESNREDLQDYVVITHVDIAPGGEYVALSTQDGKLHLYDWQRGASCEQTKTLDTNYDLHVQGCTFIDLHEQSKGRLFTEHKRLMRQYGAIFTTDNEDRGGDTTASEASSDEQKWKSIVKKLHDYRVNQR